VCEDAPRDGIEVDQVSRVRLDPEVLRPGDEASRLAHAHVDPVDPEGARAHACDGGCVSAEADPDGAGTRGEAGWARAEVDPADDLETPWVDDCELACSPGRHPDPSVGDEDVVRGRADRDLLHTTSWRHPDEAALVVGDPEGVRVGGHEARACADADSLPDAVRARIDADERAAVVRDPDRAERGDDPAGMRSGRDGRDQGRLLQRARGHSEERGRQPG
jgi:hypothetical protein